VATILIIFYREGTDQLGKFTAAQTYAYVLSGNWELGLLPLLSTPLMQAKTLR